jgi:hypothetical protein
MRALAELSSTPPPVPIPGSVPKWKSQPKPRSGLELPPPRAPCRSPSRKPGSAANSDTSPLRPAQVVLLQGLLSLVPGNHSFGPPRALITRAGLPFLTGPGEATARSSGHEAGGVAMNLGLEMGVQRLSRVGQRSPSGAHRADHLRGAGFPRPRTQVAAINVDRAGREVPLSGQKGICVQWR